MLKVGVNSEFGNLKSVLIHEPGPEVENMTPATAERALYSDILNLPIARDEYSIFKSILNKVTHVVEIRDLLLNNIVKKPEAKNELIHALENYSKVQDLSLVLDNLSDEQFTKTIIEGIPLPQVSLSNFLKQDQFAVNPLHNFFFMRDASFSIGNTIYVSSMARTVRKPESIILDIIYRHSIDECCNVCLLSDEDESNITIEGGDVLVASPEVLIIGIGSRTTPEAVDRLIQKVSQFQDLKTVLIQELPHEPESFIHIDMVFTLLSDSECMVYKPLVLGENRYHTIKMDIDNGIIKKIAYVKDLLKGLHLAGLDYKPVYCGGGNQLLQEREQWHSGANFFTFSPGKIIGYQRNIHTAEALNKHGYEVISGYDFLDGNVNIDNYKKYLITIEGSELARGGGGPRCMTMPLLRE
ncbi:MAG: arginine deiminase [Bacteroidales bacterium]|nr:arginine deiminase [Bacteroidales bacterium]MBN2819145.1 arginine deiminase [Bacteroidales bacterium]